MLGQHTIVGCSMENLGRCSPLVGDNRHKVLAQFPLGAASISADHELNPAQFVSKSMFVMGASSAWAEMVQQGFPKVLPTQGGVCGWHFPLCGPGGTGDRGSISAATV